MFSEELLAGILIGMVLMLVLDHFVFPILARHWPSLPERRHHRRPVRVERRRGGE